MVQWLRIHLAIHGTRVWSLVGELRSHMEQLKPMCSRDHMEQLLSLPATTKTQGSQINKYYFKRQKVKINKKHSTSSWQFISLQRIAAHVVERKLYYYCKDWFWEVANFNNTDFHKVITFCSKIKLLLWKIVCLSIKTVPKAICLKT